MSNPFRWLMLRTRAVFARRALERDMKHELHTHLEQATQRLMARGMSPRDAADAARREFGNVAMLEEEARDARGARIIESVLADIRFAFRYFARKPLTTITIVVVLALGIGANTALFSVIQAFTLRPAAGVPKIASHVRVWGLEQPKRGEEWRVREMSIRELDALAARTETFAEVAGWSPDEVILQGGEGRSAQALPAEFVTPNYWRVLGVTPVAGPGYAAPTPGVADLAAVVSFATAEDLFTSPVAAIGKTIMINEVAVRIVGVAPPRFEGALPDNGRPQLWLPLSARAEVVRSGVSRPEESTVSVFARLAPGATELHATAIARDVAARMLPDSAARAGVVRTAEVRSLRSPPPSVVANDQLVGFAALGVVALLILIVACTNVSSLLVAAAVGRRHEIAVRLSLGASRARVLRQLLTESTLLAIAGASAGLIICWGITTIIARLVNVDIVPDVLTMGFTMAFALGTGLLFGLSPALHATRDGVATALRDSGSGATKRSRLQRVFVIAQIVFSQPLLVLIAVILSVALRQGLPTADPVTDRVISAYFRPIGDSAALNERPAAVARLGALIAAQPGIDQVMPEAAAFEITRLSAAAARGEGSGGAQLSARIEGARPGYLALLDIPIVLGRDVSLSDTAATEYPVVIGSDLARTIWGGENPVGRTLAPEGWRATPTDSAPMIVVGVYDATRMTSRGMGIRVYTARGAHWRRDVLLIRTAGPARAQVTALHEFMRTNAPTLPATNVRTLADIINRDRRGALQTAAAAIAAGALALALASIGLFAVVALAVGQRRREIGIRIALGAEPMRVAGMFFVSGLWMCVTGLLIGLPVSVVSLRVALTQGVILAEGFNLPLMGIGIAFVMLAVAAAATWFPARRAATVDPSLALRSE